jgi:hypothetical protein
MKTNEVMRKLTLAGWMVACSFWPARRARRVHRGGSKEAPLKRVIPTAALLLTLCPDAFAQSGLIVRGGFNWSNASIDPEVDQKPQPGFNAALLADVSLAGPLSLIMGSGFETRGVAGDDGRGFRLNYLTMPVMISLHEPFAPGGPGLFVNLGTESAFLVSSDRQINEVAFDNYELGLRTEVGAEFPVVPNGPSALVGAAYSYSLTDANEDEDDTWYNYALHVFLGLEFGI